MRLVIDMQGAQTPGSRNRGIGRYTLSLVKEIIRLRGDNEVILVLNSRFQESIESLRAAFEGQIPQSSILVMDVIESISLQNPAHAARRKAAEMAREALFTRLRADIVLVTSLFEGADGTDSVITIGTFTRQVPTAVILYDLIPLIFSDIYLKDVQTKSYYFKKIDHLRRADLLLAISESSKNETIDYLGIPTDGVVNISTSCDSHFKPTIVSEVEINLLRRKFALFRPFVMYTGGIDFRKNIEGLIGAYARLSKHIRTDHQLAIVCSANAVQSARLLDLAKAMGLDQDEVVMTGYVSEEDLLALYNLCKVFVFPSWHEGFGLPALEAMACGRAVIGSNKSSIPEVLGLEDALFDPYDEESIARKMELALTDEGFRLSLQTHGVAQAKKFSWEQTARRAWDALIRCASKRKEASGQVETRFSPRPRLAYISPLPPAKSGISDYSAELLPELSRHYEIEVIVAQNEVSDSWIRANHPIRDYSWFLRNVNRYDRVLYQFGNSDFHEHMFDLLSKVAGVVVLHDFFLSGIIHYMDVRGHKPHGWARSLLHAHGWPSVRARYKTKNISDVIYDYPCNLEIIQQALGIIVHSDFSLKLATSLYGGQCTDNWTFIPHLRKPVIKPDRQCARQKLKLHEDVFVVCSFGHLAPTKLNKRLLSAWLASPLASDANCQLVFVGESTGSYGEKLAQFMKTNERAGSVKITGWVDDGAYRTWLQAANIGVQLRARTRGETSGSVLHCMNFGLATIVNANGSMANLPPDAVWMLPDEFSDEELIKALVTLWKNSDVRHSIETRAREVIHVQHQPQRCAKQYALAIERYYDSEADGSHALVNHVARIEPPLVAADWKPISVMLANNFPMRPRRKQLLVDVSELVQRDDKIGIQQAVRGVLHELLLSPPVGWLIEPVYETHDTTGYRYARRFTSQFLGIPDDWAEDETVEAWPGDIFLGLDLNPRVPSSAKNCLTGWHQRGVRVLFVVYDLLPILIPETFLRDAPWFPQWVSTVCEFDGVICVSRAVSEDINRWYHANGPKRERPLSVNWFHLGMDVKVGAPLDDMSADAVQVLKTLGSRVSFVMVAAIKPCQEYAQTLAAFELLWSEGRDINLVFVGKQGWMVESLINQIRAHSELGKRLFWLEGISDGYLENVYSACQCLIALSIGEDFGLSLIEAAQNKLPIIARDIPIFREIAGAHAFYFGGVDSKDLGDAIKHWIALRKENKHPKSDDMPWLTWKQSTRQLLERIDLEPSE